MPVKAYDNVEDCCHAVVILLLSLLPLGKSWLYIL